MKPSLEMVVLLLLPAESAFAGWYGNEGVLWDGGGSGDLWTTPQNWVGDSVPGSSQNASINNPAVGQPVIDASVDAGHQYVTVGGDNGPVTFTIQGRPARWRGSASSWTGPAHRRNRASTKGMSGVYDLPPSKGTRKANAVLAGPAPRGACTSSTPYGGA